MLEPKRLVDEGADDFEREVLQSAESDVGSDASLQQTLAAVGFVSLGAGAVTAAKAAAAGPAVLAAAEGGRLLLLKKVGLCILGAGVTFGAYRAYQAATLDAPPAATQTASAAAPSATEARVSVEATEEAGDAAAEAQAPPARSARPQRPVQSPATALPSLADEVASLDGARAALASGNPAKALAELDQYHKTFPRGRLGLEAQITRLEALVAAGNRPAAEALGDRLLRSPYAKSHAARIRSILGR